MNRHDIYRSDRRTLKDVLFLLGIAVALGLGLALASPALGAALRQSSDGDISGTITVAGGNPAGITVELRQRSNNGGDTLLATTTTDAGGVYHFGKQGSAPNDAYYQVKVAGSKGMLAAWYSFPIIYLAGQSFVVPSIEMADVALLTPRQGEKVGLPTKLVWQARRSGETFRVYVYDAANPGKAVLDSGSLGMNNEYALPEGSLAPGNYEAVVQVRDAVVGYGVSQGRFRFSVVDGNGTAGGDNTGGAPEPTPGATGDQGEGDQGEGAPGPTGPSEVDLSLHLTANETEVRVGDSLVYRVEVTNNGNNVAPEVVLTDKLPAGVAVDAPMTKSSVGLVSVEGNSVTVQIGDMEAQEKAWVEIPVKVSANAGSNISNQVSALYMGAANPVLSNSYTAQVASSPQGPDNSQPEAQATAQPTSQATAETTPRATTEATAQATAQATAMSTATAPASPQVEPTTQAVQPTQAAQAPQPTAQTEAQPQQPTPAGAPTTAPRPTESAGTATGGSGSGGSSGQPKAPMPETGGSFPLVFAVLLLAATLAARYLRGYLRGRNHRRT